MLGAAFAPALGSLASTPLGRAALRYWWVTVPVGYLAWGFYQERRKKGTANIAGLVQDMTPVVSVVGTLVLLNEAMRRAEATRQAAAAQAQPPPAPKPQAIDAEFTPMPPSQSAGS